MRYVQVSEKMDDEPIELPLEDDGTLLLSSLNAQFPNATGLKYRASNMTAWRGIRLHEGRLYAPDDCGVNGGGGGGGSSSSNSGDGERNLSSPWGDHLYVCVYPKAAEKRAFSEIENDADTRVTKPLSKRIDRKCSDLVILNISYSTKEDTLRQYLSQFGELVLCQLKMDVNGRSKGFGFCRYMDYESQRAVLSKRHMIDGRWCDIRLPVSKLQHMNDPNENSPYKLFVGRVEESLSNTTIANYFQKYGEITEVFRPTPFRGFVFVSFVDTDVVEEICSEDDHVIDGVSVHVANATPKRKMMPTGAAGGDVGPNGPRGMMAPMGYAAQEASSYMFEYGPWRPSGNSGYYENTTKGKAMQQSPSSYNSSPWIRTTTGGAQSGGGRPW